METPTVYVICDKNCKFEGMTKEQIYTAIAQAVKSGYIGDINTGFVQTIKTINNQPLKFFVGAQSEYNALSEEDKENLFAIITNGTEKDELIALLENHEERIQTLERYQASSHASTADKATNADYASKAGKISSLQSAYYNADRPVWFSDSDSEGLPSKDRDGTFKYNPSTQTLKVENIADSSGAWYVKITDVESEAEKFVTYNLPCEYTGSTITLGLPANKKSVDIYKVEMVSGGNVLGVVHTDLGDPIGAKNVTVNGVYLSPVNYLKDHEVTLFCEELRISLSRGEGPSFGVRLVYFYFYLWNVVGTDNPSVFSIIDKDNKTDPNYPQTRTLRFYYK